MLAERRQAQSSLARSVIFIGKREQRFACAREFAHSAPARGIAEKRSPFLIADPGENGVGTIESAIDRPQHARFGQGKSVRERGILVHQPIEGSGDERQVRAFCHCDCRQARRLVCRERFPRARSECKTVVRHRPPFFVQVGKVTRRELPETHESLDLRKRIDADDGNRVRGNVERLQIGEDLQQLQLIVEVHLKPQRDPAMRIGEGRIALGKLVEGGLVRSPTAIGGERCPNAAQFFARDACGHRAFV